MNIEHDESWKLGYQTGRRKQAAEDEWRLKMMRDELARLRESYLRQLVWRLFTLLAFDTKPSEAMILEVAQVLPSPEEALRWMKEEHEAAPFSNQSGP